MRLVGTFIKKGLLRPKTSTSVRRDPLFLALLQGKKQLPPLPGRWMAVWRRGGEAVVVVVVVVWCGGLAVAVVWWCDGGGVVRRCGGVTVKGNRS